MFKLKILVFEFITGGGLNKSELPPSLAQEGFLMLQSLLDDFAEIQNIELNLMLDYRIKERFALSNFHTHLIDPTVDCQQEFARLLKSCTAAWPIAPESDHSLHTLCKNIEKSGKYLLTSGADTVAITGDKWLTYNQLSQNSIPTVSTQMLGDFSWSSGEWMLKPRDGVGCENSYLITNQADFTVKTAALDQLKYIIQPHIPGDKISLSCLFKEGKGWLLCANRQQFELINQQYRLIGITVNVAFETAKYLPIVAAIANVFPGLWGYAGIDLIETEHQILVLEINPRLTTSYAGVKKSLGINCAKAVLELMNGDPQLIPNHHQSIDIEL